MTRSASGRPRGIPAVMTSVLILAAAFGAAQESKTPAPAPADVQARYEPPAGPGRRPGVSQDLRRRLDRRAQLLPSLGRRAEPAAGECSQKMVQDGRFLESAFTFHQDGKTTSGTGISGFDPQTGLFTTFWFDSRSTRFSVRQSREPFDGKQIVLYSVSLGVATQSRVSRTVTHLEDDGRRLIHQQFNQGSDGKERLLMELIMKRKGT